MKKQLLLLASALFCAITFAQTVPQGINYQAVARDATGSELTNQALTVRLSVMSGASTGTLSWEETHSVITNDFGLFTAVIGQGASTGLGSSSTFSEVDWGSAAHYMKVEINTGSGYVDMGTNELLSVPYALQAGKLVSGSTGQTLRHNGADWVATSNIYNDGTNVGIGTNAPGLMNTGVNESFPKLHVYGSETSDTINDNAGIFLDLQNALSGGVTGLRFKVKGGLYANAYQHAGIFFKSDYSASGTGSIYFCNKGGSNATPVGVYDADMVLTSAGLIGIGTPNPSYKLDVSGDINFTGDLYKNGVLFNGADNLGNHIATQSLDLDTNDIKKVRYLGFKRGGELNNISTNSDGHLIFSVNDDDGGTQVMAIDDDNYSVAIGNGATPSGYKLSVDGKIICEELRVELEANWPDYVFDKNYNLMSLKELESYIEWNNHLPNIPTANEMEDSGVEMGEMTRLLMEKIEELTLYMIDANNRIEELENELKNKIE